jgi:glycosyltransferase involved in cell wall biosynthesis
MPPAEPEPHICVFTVHPPNDQRILRQLRTLRDAGYRTTLIDLGSPPSRSTSPGADHMTLMAPQRGSLSRVLASAKVARQAWRTRADIYHLHDFYLLPAALVLRALRRRPVVYDVHEYYPDYYASKVPYLAGTAGRLIGVFEGVAARALGNVSVVSAELGTRLGRGRTRVAVTPNFPSIGSFLPMTQEPYGDYAAKLRRVVNTGTLNPEYGVRVLIDIGHEIDRRGLDLTLSVIRRFHQEAHRRDFDDYLAERGTPRCLELHDPMPPDALGTWLRGFGIGLSVVQSGNPALNAVHTKLYEYAISGLSIVASDLPRPRLFLEGLGHGELVPPAEPQRYVDAIERFVADPEKTLEGARQAAARMLDTMTWEGSGAPPLLALYADAVRRPGR